MSSSRGFVNGLTLHVPSANALSPKEVMSMLKPSLKQQNMRQMTRHPHLDTPKFRPISDVASVAELLTFKRPAGSDTEKQFISMYLDGIPGIQQDEIGNRFISIGTSYVTMFSSHTDTVHHTPGYQTLAYDTVAKHLFANNSECLGADDGAGVYTMLRMMEAKVPGLYVFHRAEECGGHGSMHFAKTQQHGLLANILHCVAFDRKGMTSIITHQSGERTASDAYCLALASELGMAHVLDDGGLFTDSVNYAHFIPECTNISVGYEQAHSSGEYLATEYLDDLIKHLIAVPWDILRAHRDPFTPEFKDSYYTGLNGWKSSSNSAADTGTFKSESVSNDYLMPTMDDLIAFCNQDPVGAAAALYNSGVSWEDIEAAVDTGFPDNDNTSSFFNQR